MNEAPRPLTVGDVLHGYAFGVFGRDHYSCCRIEATGPDWIVARNADSGLSFASGRDSLLRLIDARDRPCPNEICMPQPEPPLTA